MFLIKLISLLVPNIIYKKNVANPFSSEIDIHKNVNLGYDERYVNYYTNVTIPNKSHKSRIEDIVRYVDVLEKINALQKANTLGPSIHDETIQQIVRDEIGHMGIYAYNSRNGGLLSDW